MAVSFFTTQTPFLFIAGMLFARRLSGIIFINKLIITWKLSFVNHY